jgi:hypothetical protein
MRCLDLGIADHREVVPEAGTTHQEAKIHAPLSAARLPCLPRMHLSPISYLNV